MNAAERIIAKFGGQTSLGRLIGRPQTTVEHWAIVAYIPEKWRQRLLDLAIERGVLLSPAEFSFVAVRRRRKRTRQR